MATVAELLSNAGTRMQQAVEALERELQGVRTGRASPAIRE